MEKSSVEPFVCLINGPPSYGPGFLTYLGLSCYRGRPRIGWNLDGRGCFQIIPEEMLPELTPESLIDWAIHTEHKDLFIRLASFPAYVSDRRVIDWCAQVRYLYGTEATPTQPVTWTYSPGDSPVSLGIKRSTGITKKYLHFSGSPHGDQVYLHILPDKSVAVECSNDGYPDRFGGGGYSRPLPFYFISSYHQSAFINWLQQNFWINSPIEISHPVDEEKVREFLAQCR